MKQAEYDKLFPLFKRLKKQYGAKSKQKIIEKMGLTETQYNRLGTMFNGSAYCQDKIAKRKLYAQQYREKRMSEPLAVLEEKAFRFQKRCDDKAEITFTAKDIVEKYGENPVCFFTGEPINYRDKDSFSLDHFIPASRGGGCSLDNLRLVTKGANQAKGQMTPEEFIALCKTVAARFPDA